MKGGAPRILKGKATEGRTHILTTGAKPYQTTARPFTNLETGLLRLLGGVLACALVTVVAAGLGSARGG